jgi:hypothetical protein
MVYPANCGMEVMINNEPLLFADGSSGIKEGAGDFGLVVDRYNHEGLEFFVIDMGNGQELHFTREHFDIVEEP